MPISKADQTIIDEMRERYTYAKDEWREIRDEGAKDMKYISGDPWESKDRTAREDAGRPVLTFDEFGQYVNQVINDLRQNKRGIKVTARGFGATEQTARFRQGKIRDIEYTSNAQQAYTTMAQDAIQRSYGYLRIRAKYVSAKGGFSQEPVIEPIVNPDMVLPDPDVLRRDGTDWKYLFFYETRSVKEFDREFPDAEKKSFTVDDQKVGGDWWNGQRLMLAEYWTKERTSTRKQLLLKPPARTAQNPNPEPIEVWEDELQTTPSSEHIKAERAVDQFTVINYLTNGFEILKKTPWPGQSIPFVGCYGKIIFVNGKRQILSMVRLARGPAMLLNYIRTSQMELVGMTPKFPYFYYEGQLSPDALQLLAKSLHEPVVGIPIKPTVPGAPVGQVLPPPSRQPYEPAIQVLELLAESIRRSIQAAIGANFLPSQAQKRNEKSGKALQQIESSAQKGSFHFTDSYDEAITRTGALLDEVIPAYFDTAQDTSIRTPSDDPEMVRVNDEAAKDKSGQPAFLPVDPNHQHDVTISVGPAMESEREAASDFADTIVGNHEIASVIGPQKTAELIALAIKLKNVGPLGDQMAEIISPKQGQQDPKRAMQQAQQLQQENQQLKGVLQEAEQEKRAKTMELASKEKIAGAELLSKERLEVRLQAMKNASALGVAKINLLGKGIESANEAQVEAIALAHEAEQAEHQRAHEVGLAALAHQHGLDAGAAAHDQALEAGDQGHQQTLEAAQQAAALAPEPAQPEAGA